MLHPRLIYLASYINTIFLNKLRSSYYHKSDGDIGFILIPRRFAKLAINYPSAYRILETIILFALPFLFFIKTTFSVLKVSITYIFHKKRTFNSSRLFLYTSHAIIKTAKRINLFNDSDYLLIFPFSSCKEISIEQQLVVLDLLNFFNIWNSYIQSIRVFFIIIFRFGYKESFYNLNAFNWFLLYNTLMNVSINIELYMSNQKDRWAFLIDKLPHRSKRIVQHGSNFLKRPPSPYSIKYLKYYSNDELYTVIMPLRLSNISIIYAFTKMEAKYMLIGEIKNRPEIQIIGYNMQLTDMQSNDYKVLLVGNYTENAEIEKQLISLLLEKPIKLYLKSHPLVNKNKYSLLNRYFDFEIVEKDCFPRVDIVFSYSSTLASEYENYGINVVYFSDLLRNGNIDSNKLNDVFSDVQLH
jgi:hypothetical protein